MVRCITGRKYSFQDITGTDRDKVGYAVCRNDESKLDQEEARRWFDEFNGSYCVTRKDLDSTSCRVWTFYSDNGMELFTLAVPGRSRIIGIGKESMTRYYQQISAEPACGNTEAVTAETIDNRNEKTDADTTGDDDTSADNACISMPEFIERFSTTFSEAADHQDQYCSTCRNSSGDELDADRILAQYKDVAFVPCGELDEAAADTVTFLDDQGHELFAIIQYDNPDNPDCIGIRIEGTVRYYQTAESFLQSIQK